MQLIQIRNSQNGEEIGLFEFANLPKSGEQVTVPWDDDPDGVRIFEVVEVLHVARGVVPSEEHSQLVGPYTVLTATEFT